MRRLSSRSNGDRLLILGYHSIGSTWRWPASPEETRKSFAYQMRALRRTVNFVSLDEALHSLDAGRPLPPRAVALTFDDGYLDNLTVAAPVLKQLRIPATMFLVPGLLSGEVHAWWERLSWAIRRARVSSVDFEGRRFDLTGSHKRFLALNDVERSLKDRDHATRQSAVESLVDALDPEGRYYADELFMDWDGARELVRAGFSIGSHTMSHAILARETEACQRADLADSRRLLHDRLKTPVETLCYPNGSHDDYDSTTIDAARAAGYSHALTVWGQISSPDTPAYEIRRMMVDPHLLCFRMAARVERVFRRPSRSDADLSTEVAERSGGR